MKKTILFITLLWGTNLSAATMDECDPQVDPWRCECGNTSGTGTTCDVIDADDYSHLADPKNWDTSAWITTSWDSSAGHYVVTAFMDYSEGKGLFMPLENEGEWDTIDDLSGWLSEVLQVPLHTDGHLEPFTYRQIGRSLIVDPYQGVYFEGAGIFWYDLIRDVEGAIDVLDNGRDPLLDQINCDPEDTATYKQTSTTEYGTTHSVRQTGSICWTMYPCSLVPGVSCQSGQKFTSTNAHALTEVLSVYGNSWDFVFEQIPLGECDGSSCVLHPRWEIIDQHPGFIRFFQVTSNIYVLSDLFLDGSWSYLYEYYGNGVGAFAKSFPRASTHFGTSAQPAFNSQCSEFDSTRGADVIEGDLLTHIPWGSNNVPSCP